MHKNKFKVGDRVVVLQYSEYRSAHAFEVGEVEQCFRRGSNNPTVYGIRLDNSTNKSSAKGLFWFEAKSLNFENKERKEEDFMFNNYVVAKVSFQNDPVALVPVALYDPEVSVGDKVVVATLHHGFSVATVCEINTDEESKKLVKCGREVVCYADFSAYNNRKVAAKRIVELKRDMDKRIREAQELALYETLAEKDSTLKVMLDEYKVIMESCK